MTRTIDPEVRRRICLALDVSSLESAGKLIQALAPYVGSFKVGLELLTAEGAPKVVSFVHSYGGAVFFDGKFCDIPNTVGNAAAAAAKMGVTMFNVHASAGVEAMKAAVANKGSALALAVTVLTSLEQEQCKRSFGKLPEDKVLEFASMARKAEMDGIICSPKEAQMLRSASELSHMKLVTPGIRSSWYGTQDQKRVMTPAEAVRAGVDIMVIGRQITEPPEGLDVVQAALRVHGEIAAVL